MSSTSLAGAAVTQPEQPITWQDIVTSWPVVTALVGGVASVVMFAITLVFRAGRLASALENLTRAIEGIVKRQEAFEDRLQAHGEAIARLEGAQDQEDRE